jgi:hypothetical protein
VDTGTFFSPAREDWKLAAAINGLRNLKVEIIETLS